MREGAAICRRRQVKPFQKLGERLSNCISYRDRLLTGRFVCTSLNKIFACGFVLITTSSVRAILDAQRVHPVSNGKPSRRSSECHPP